MGLSGVRFGVSNTVNRVPGWSLLPLTPDDPLALHFFIVAESHVPLVLVAHVDSGTPPDRLMVLLSADLPLIESARVLLAQYQGGV